jgi:peptidoglycan/xylan/chitin deacetylase (PgdA/CDA1 family)
MKNIGVDVSIIGVILVLSTISISLYPTFLPTAVFSQSEDDTSDNNEDSDTPENSVSYGENNKFVILTFDDGYKSQYTTAKPILDKYGYKATFYVVCNYAQKEDADRMNWNDIQELQKQGHDIGSHTMNHHDLTQIPSYRIDYEIGVSKQCLLNNGINTISSFAYPFAKGSANATIVDRVAKHYPIARTADAPLMFLDCKGWNNDNEDGSDDISFTINSRTSQDDCREYSDDGNLNMVNRYTVRGWAHDSERAENLFSDEYMVNRFKEVVDSQTEYNEDNRIKAIPIIIWHNIANNVENDPYTTTSIDLFEAEIKYLYDNGFTVLTMDDLIYDEYNKSLKIVEGKINSDATDPSIISQIDHPEEVKDDNKEDNT